jgi:hypothetical protein
VLLPGAAAWAKDETPAASESTPFTMGYMFVALFIGLGIMAVARSTVRTPSDEN